MTKDDVPYCYNPSIAFDDDDAAAAADDDREAEEQSRSSGSLLPNRHDSLSIQMFRSFFILTGILQLHLIGSGSGSARAQSPADCSTVFVFNQVSYNLSNCMDLQVQSARLAWTYHSSNNSVDMVFSGTAPRASGWVGWGINPSHRNRMVGTSSLIAFVSSQNGSNVLPYKLTSRVQDSRDPCACTPIDFVITTTAVEISGTSMSFLVSFKLPSNSTTLNHIWGRGSSVSNFQPLTHGLSSNDLTAYKVINMDTTGVSVQATDQGSGSSSSETLERAHGILSLISWGILFPLGAMAARYLRPISDPAWFYIHISCQTLAYALGVSSWALGMKLRSDSTFIYTSHQNIGIALFVFSTLQMFAFFLRPGKDMKIRKYWNVYHHLLGYTIIGLSIINIFKGIDIYEGSSIWSYGYIGSLCVLIAASLLLEIAMWVRRRRHQRS